MTICQPSIGVVGGGVLGLAVAHRLVRDGARVTVFEKEDRLARHQTGRNSGVAHAGVYYAPGSLKATLCRRGVVQLASFCATHGVRYVECGKVIVATEPSELHRLVALHERATANEVPGVRLIDGDELRRIEPSVQGSAALLSPTTAIVDFVGFVEVLRRIVESAGGVVRTGSEVVELSDTSSGAAVSVRDAGTEQYDAVVVCAGLHADRMALLGGSDGGPRIVPFRGEYFDLVPHRRELVRGLVYPVPDPALPFLGLHFTPTVHGHVLVGPNAVLALAREGYRWRDVDVRETWDLVRWVGFRRLARDHWRTGLREVYRSLSRRAFAAEARRFVPSLRVSDLRRAPAGVRAQAVVEDGSLMDDFCLESSGRILHVRNAPSPAATSSLAIADTIVDALEL